MSLAELLRRLAALNETIEGGVFAVTDAASAAQQQVYDAILVAINEFQIEGGSYVVDQDLTARIATITRKIERILGDVYAPALSEYFGTYRTIQDEVIALHKTYNDLKVEVGKLAPARKAIYNQAKRYLTEGLADAYVQPAKYLIMQHVTTGISIKDSERILRSWNDGELTAGAIASNRPTPNLQKYATQVARDSAYQYSGAIQEVIKDEYGR